MYIFLGCRYLDYTNRTTGQVINGYQIFMYQESDRGVGMEPIKFFLSPEKFISLFGSDMNFFKPYILKPCSPLFGYKGRLEGIQFERK